MRHRRWGISIGIVAAVGAVAGCSPSGGSPQAESSSSTPPAQSPPATASSTTESAYTPGRHVASDPVRSMFISIGTEDPIVPYDKQKRGIPRLQRKLGVDPRKATFTGYLRSEPGRGRLELAAYVYPGGHAPPPEVFGLVIEFVQRHTLSGG